MANKTYIAILDKGGGYVLDLYPGERDRNFKYYGKRILGEYPTHKEAETVLHQHMAAWCEKQNMPHWWRTH